MAHRVTCYVTGFAESGSAFAIRQDNDESVFIPASTANKLELGELDEIEAVVIPNKHADETSTKWFAVRARLMEETE